MTRSAREDPSRSPEAVLLSIVADSGEQVEPRCSHYGVCGGCQLQHVTEATQLAGKRATLLQVLQAAGLEHLPEPQVHAAEPWGYRNRTRLRVEGTQIGYNKRAANDFLPIRECPLLSPLAWRAAYTLERLTQAGKASWPAGTRAFEVFADAHETALQLSLYVDATVATVDREAPRALRSLCEELKHLVPELAGGGLLVSAVPNPAQTRRVQESGRVEIARWGEASLLYNVSGIGYRVTRNAFFQVNRFLTAALRDLVVGDRAGRLAYDLYAGAGLFAVPLAGQFQQVVAVEIGEPAATDLRTHLRACGPRHRAVQDMALHFLQAHTGAAPDLIVLDPPRAGLGRETARALAATGAREVVYVSCDAGSFARDCRTLVESGYTLATLHLVDLFPSTLR